MTNTEPPVGLPALEEAGKESIEALEGTIRKLEALEGWGELTRDQRILLQLTQNVMQLEVLAIGTAVDTARLSERIGLLESTQENPNRWKIMLAEHGMDLAQLRDAVARNEEQIRAVGKAAGEVASRLPFILGISKSESREEVDVP